MDNKNCYYCYYCYYCYDCYYCNYCDYCKNLKMTEYNLFCYSKSYNDENSFQQKRYRVFNIEVGKDRHNELRTQCVGILGEPRFQLSDFWKQVTQDQWKQLMDLAKEVRGYDFREGFEYISGQKIELKPETMIEVNGKKYSASTIQEALKRYVNE